VARGYSPPNISDVISMIVTFKKQAQKAGNRLCSVGEGAVKAKCGRQAFPPNYFWI
jgi:hypothetical protein